MKYDIETASGTIDIRTKFHKDGWTTPKVGRD
jgi:hypothetical protein